MSKTSITADPGKQAIIITRIFDAPRDLVFKVVTDPKSIPQWWGPKTLSTVVETMEVKPGGSWRFQQRDTDGNEYGFHGVYHDVTAPQRIIDTFEFEGFPESGHVALETITLESIDGGKKTKYTAISVFQSVADRDGMVQSDMESGVRESHERLDLLLAQNDLS